MKKTDAIQVRREIPAVISDKGRVKVGNYTPLFPAPVPADRHPEE